MRNIAARFMKNPEAQRRKKKKHQMPD